MANQLVTPIVITSGEGLNPDIGSQNQSNMQWKPRSPQGALARNPDTTNLQSPLSFRFWIKRSPNVNYFVNRVNMPGLSLPLAPQATIGVTVPQPGDHVQFEPLVLTFRVDEGMSNYFEISEWMKAVSGFDPEDFAELAKHAEWTGEGLLSEIIVTVLNAQKNVIRIINYHNCWPTQLSTLQFDVSLTEVEYTPATAVFYYLNYTTSTDV